MILKLYYYDHPVLRKKALPIEQITDEIRQFAQDMIESMIYYNGVGLASPQVGKLIRLLVLRDEWMGPDGKYHLGAPEVMINPVLSNPSKDLEIMPEGCISVPGVHPDVARPFRITVTYLNLDGKEIVEERMGHRARVAMHENDHLNGVLNIDRMSSKARRKIEPVLLAIKKKYANQ